MMWRWYECKSTCVKLISCFGLWCFRITLLPLVLLTSIRTAHTLGLSKDFTKWLDSFPMVWDWDVIENSRFLQDVGAKDKSTHVCRVYAVVARLVNRCVCAGIAAVSQCGFVCDEARWCVSHSLWSTTSSTEPTQPLQHEAPMWHNSLPSEKPLRLGKICKKKYAMQKQQRQKKKHNATSTVQGSFFTG